MARLNDKLRALEAMGPTDLNTEGEAAHGSAPPRLGPKLMQRLLAQRLQERRHGGLPLMVARELERIAEYGA